MRIRTHSRSPAGAQWRAHFPRPLREPRAGHRARRLSVGRTGALDEALQRLVTEREGTAPWREAVAFDLTRQAIGYRMLQLLQRSTKVRAGAVGATGGATGRDRRTGDDLAAYARGFAMRAASARLSIPARSGDPMRSMPLMAPARPDALRRTLTLGTIAGGAALTAARSTSAPAPAPDERRTASGWHESRYTEDSRHLMTRPTPFQEACVWRVADRRLVAVGRDDRFGLIEDPVRSRMTGPWVVRWSDDRRAVEWSSLAAQAQAVTLRTDAAIDQVVLAGEHQPLAVLLGKHSLSAWSLKEPVPRWSVSLGEKSPARTNGPSGRLHASRDGRWLVFVTRQGGLIRCDTRSGELLPVEQGSTVADDSDMGLRFSRDGHRLAMGRFSGALIVSTQTWRPEREVRGATVGAARNAFMIPVAEQPDGGFVFQMDWGMACVVPPDDGAVRGAPRPYVTPSAQFDTANHFSFAAEGTLRAMYEWQRDRLWLLDLRTQAPARELRGESWGTVRGPQPERRAIALSPDGQLLAMSVDTARGQVNGFWDTRSGRYLGPFQSASSG